MRRISSSKPLPTSASKRPPANCWSRPMPRCSLPGNSARRTSSRASSPGAYRQGTAAVERAPTCMPACRSSTGARRGDPPGAGRVALRGARRSGGQAAARRACRSASKCARWSAPATPSASSPGSAGDWRAPGPDPGVQRRAGLRRVLLPSRRAWPFCMAIISRMRSPMPLHLFAFLRRHRVQFLLGQAEALQGPASRIRSAGDFCMYSSNSS